MLKKIIVLHLFCITTNRAFKLSAEGESNSSSSSRKVMNAVTENSWQPLMHIRKWLPPPSPTTITPTLSLLTAQPESFSSSEHLTFQIKYRQHINNSTPSSQRSMRLNGINYNNNFSGALTPLAAPSPPSIDIPTQANVNNHPLKYHVSATNSGSEKFPLASDYYRELRQPSTLRKIKTETQYIQARLKERTPSIMYHTKNREYSLPTQVNLNNLNNSVNTAQHTEIAYSSLHVSPPSVNKNHVKNIPKPSNLFMESSSTENTKNLLPTTLNYFANDENVIDSQMPNVRVHQTAHQHLRLQQPHNNRHHHQLPFNSNNINSPKETADKKVLKATQFARTFSDANDSNANNGETSNNAQELYGRIKDKTPIVKPNISGSRSSHYGDNNPDLNGDDTTDNSESKLRRTSQQFMAALLNTPLDKSDTLNATMPPASPGNISNEVLLRLQPSERELRGAEQERNLQVLPCITSSTLLASAPTSIGSGRKIKKLKKKFEKFLVPLLLAYKLKFMLLIPLLISGLILLVGSTGLAGFFFALFTAVMSLKMDNGSAIIVKKL